MCSIFGVVGSYDAGLALESFNLLLHRGPDEQKLIQTKDYFWASHRLAITATKTSFYAQDIEIAFNGEIYNQDILKQAIGPYVWTTKNETELIYAAYKKWGVDFIKHVQGMFAIALYDKTQMSLTLFRDLLGKKPLFYHHAKERFIFSSELKAIKHYDKTLVLDPDATHDFLAYQCLLSPNTFYENVFSLQAGTYVTFKEGKIKQTCYDDILPVRISVYDEYEAQAIIKEGLIQSLEKRQAKEVDMAYLLSGGLDSSLLCAMAQKQQEKPLETFTIGYEGHESFDESPYAKEVARHIGSKNERVIYTYDDFKRGLKDILTLMDQPHNDPAILPLAHLFKHIKSNTTAKVVISGEGSDELFLGYKPHKELDKIEHLKNLQNKNWLKSYFLKHESEHREWEWYRRVLEGDLLFRSSAESLSFRQKNKLLRKKQKFDRALEQVSSYHRAFKRKGIQDHLLWYRYSDIKIHQGDYFLTKLDRVSMASSLETRTPYLDEVLVKRSLEIQSALCIKGDISKYLLKELALEYLPASIVNRKKKGFSYPYIFWLQKAGGFKSIRMLNDKHQIFNDKALKAFLEAGSKGAYQQHIFGMYVLLLHLESEDKNIHKV